MEDTLERVLAGLAAGDAGQPKAMHGLLNHLRDAPLDRDDLLQFIAFAMHRAKRSKAQLFQDLWAQWVSDERCDGFFVEFGAGDGVHLSNTHLLEQTGWRGVVAEPNPDFIDRLRANRRCQISDRCVYSQSDLTMAFTTTRIGEFSHLSDVVPADAHQARRAQGAVEVKVRTISLNDLLIQAGAPRRIDYLSVDTEGSELEILRVFDFDRWDVRAISVEHNKTPARAGLYELLTARGYRRQWPQFSRFDDWYVRD